MEDLNDDELCNTNSAVMHLVNLDVDILPILIEQVEDYRHKWIEGVKFIEDSERSMLFHRDKEICHFLLAMGLIGSEISLIPLNELKNAVENYYKISNEMNKDSSHYLFPAQLEEETILKHINEALEFIRDK